MSAIPPFPAGETLRGEKLADYIELRVLMSNDSLRWTSVDTILRQNGIKNYKLVLDDARRILNYREECSSGTVPYNVLTSGVFPVNKCKNDILYSFMTAIAIGEITDNEGRKLFEYLVSEIIRKRLNCRSIAIGFPRLFPLSGSCLTAFTAYGSEIKEDFNLDRIRPADKDLGLDVVSWLSFRDTRGAYFHLIGQCATDLDWKDRSTEIQRPLKENIVNYSTDPITYLAIPFFCTSQETFRRASEGSGLLLDRPRLWAWVLEGGSERKLRKLLATYLSDRI